MNRGPRGFLLFFFLLFPSFSLALWLFLFATTSPISTTTTIRKAKERWEGSHALSCQRRRPRSAARDRSRRIQRNSSSPKVRESGFLVHLGHSSHLLFFFFFLLDKKPQKEQPKQQLNGKGSQQKIKSGPLNPQPKQQQQQQQQIVKANGNSKPKHQSKHQEEEEEKEDGEDGDEDFSAGSDGEEFDEDLMIEGGDSGMDDDDALSMDEEEEDQEQEQEPEPLPPKKKQKQV